MKRSIKRKIQNSMFLTNILTLLMTTFVLIPVIHYAYGPVTRYITNSIASDYVKTYEVLSSQSAMKGPGTRQFMESTSLDQVISNINELIKEEENLPDDMAIKDNMTESLKIVAQDEDDYKRIMVLAKEIFDDANIFPIKLSLIEMDVFIKDKELLIPITRNYDSSSGFSKDVQSENKIEIVNENDESIGMIAIRMDPMLYTGVNVLFVTLIIALSLFSIIFIKIISKFLSKGIMKPMHQTNEQLKRMAMNDVESLSSFQLMIKKPPAEIEEMIGHSNTILKKFKEFSELLENQNEELHMQNDELIFNRELIENQQNQLIQSEKMASVGQISAAIVHEINTPIGAIKSNAQMVDMVLTQIETQEDLESIKRKVSQMKPAVSMITTASDRVSQIIKSIKSFSRIDQSAFKDADLHEAIESVLILTSNLWKSRVTLHKKYSEIPYINCYISLINQVIMNLVVNAIDAIEGTGEITIATGLVKDEVYVSVEDNGMGIPSDKLNQIFIQGYTTKPIGKGSGLGLALSKDIMDKHNGRIEVASEEGKGSKFTLWIPLNNPDKSL
ncbi:HAMP domain-containing sensor histidine kinase [Fusibacter bizertensis]|uniref:histidine kinase n=1 Tax=Fusibacter bizertensis TaxID=1488331 RepID=A0ABT6NBN9_9FIRM|nr:HAMP domain-containing sensor histidine kinase [Fusibacter bizertensis]MDH8677836.1 HAMP domain-containing sensor histidine kinase [Fusibacter bizertensis]